jgi:hypothetical protein
MARIAHRWTVVALALFALGAAANAILGPLALGLIVFRVSPNATTQLLGGEVVSLLVVAPVALVAAVLWWRGDRLAPALAIGPALYGIYTYVQAVVGPEYARYDGNNEAAFPLYLALILLGGAITVRAWPALAALDVDLPDGLRRALAVAIVFVCLFFALAWFAGIVAVLRGMPPAEYHDDITLFWVVRLMDLGLVIPAGIVTGVALLRRAPWAVRLAVAVIGFLTLEAAAVAAMGTAMLIRGEAGASVPFAAVTAAATLTLAALGGLLLRATRATAPHAATARPGAPRPAPV